MAKLYVSCGGSQAGVRSALMLPSLIPPPHLYEDGTILKLLVEVDFTGLDDEVLAGLGESCGWDEPSTWIDSECKTVLQSPSHSSQDTHGHAEGWLAGCPRLPRVFELQAGAVKDRRRHSVLSPLDDCQGDTHPLGPS